MKFGKYMQSVMSLLVTLHSWDDPYGSISPDNDGTMGVIWMAIGGLAGRAVLRHGCATIRVSVRGFL